MAGKYVSLSLSVCVCVCVCACVCILYVCVVLTHMMWRTKFIRVKLDPFWNHSSYVCVRSTYGTRQKKVDVT